MAGHRECPGCGVEEGGMHTSNCPVKLGSMDEKGRFLWSIVRPDVCNHKFSTIEGKNRCVYCGMFGHRGSTGPVASSITIAIPPEVEQYKDDIRRFVDAMVYKLGQKAHKGRWEEMPIEKALELLREEEAELTEAVERGNLVETLLESADVANYALIVASIAIERGK